MALDKASDNKAAQDAKAKKGHDDALKQQADLNQKAAEKTRDQATALTHAHLESDMIQAELKGRQDIAEQLKIQADYTDKIAKAEKDKDPRLAAELKHQEALALARSKQLNAHKLEVNDRGKLSLSELASGGHGQVGADAREATREEARAHRAALAGDLAGSLDHQNRADALKRGIGTLKDSEKGDEFLKALDSSQKLDAIVKNTAGLGRNK